MRAMAVTKYGRPLEPVELPEPNLRPGQALVEILACGVCFSDVKTARGEMPFSADLTLPHVPGHEIVGRVLATESSGGIGEGTRVVVYHYWPCRTCAACRRGDEPLCRRLTGWIGFTHRGGFTQRIAVPMDRLVAIPDGIDPIRAAPMTCALGSAYRSVVTRGGVRAGMTLAVLGLGGVGIHAAQVGRASGARTMGFDIRDEVNAAARDLGLDARLPGEDAVTDALGSTGGEGVDVVVDTVGHDDTLELARRLVRPGGRVVGVGYSPASVLAVPSPRFVLDEVSYVGSRFAHRDDLADAISLVARGLVTPVVTLVRPLEDVNDVFAALDAGSVIGRAVLVVADDVVPAVSASARR